MLNEIEKTFLENNILYLKGVITKEKIYEIIITIQKEDLKELNVYISIDNINIQDAILLYDFFKYTNIKINTCAIGSSNGYAFLIFLAGEKRKVLPHSEIHIPKFEFNIFNSSVVISQYLNYKNKIINNIKKIYKNSTKCEMPSNFLETNLLFNSKKMLCSNIATEMVG